MIGAYSISQHPDQLDLKLFKFSEDFLESIEYWKPDIIGLSLYSWNTQLNLHIAQLAYNINPRLIIIAGGPNIPLDHNDIGEFFAKHPFVHLIVNKDGEIPFSQIVGKCLEGLNRDELIQEKLPGTISITPNSKELLFGEPGQKIKNLDEVPSPYLTGLMDKFFCI
jgi:hypothetical protein